MTIGEEPISQFQAQLEILNPCQEPPDRGTAEKAFLAALHAAHEPGQFQALFERLRFTIPKRRRPIVFEKFSETIARFDTPELMALKLRLLIAMHDFRRFMRLFADNRVIIEADGAAGWAHRFKALEAVVGQREFPNFSAPKVFGVGLSKTGTQSLTSALKRLGYLTSHFENEFSTELLETEDAFIFDAMTDTPVCIRFELLHHQFKNAKFVWTRLPRERWLDAFDRHCMRVFGTTDFSEIRRFWQMYKYQPHFADAEAIDGTLYFCYDNAHEAHQAYCQRVEHFFSDKPADKLLILETGSGEEWSKLCGFLGHDIPDEPYPWDNNSGLCA